MLTGSGLRERWQNGILARGIRRACDAVHNSPACPRREAITGATAGIIAAMEADRINLIQNSLSDLAARSAELRRYL